MTVLDGLPAPTYDAGGVWVDKLRAAGIPAWQDPRSATPPGVLVTVPSKDDTGTDRGPCTMAITWQFVCLASGTGNADAWLTLDRLDTAVRGVIGRRASSTPTAHSLSADNPPLPAYVVEFDDDIPI